MVDIEKTRSDCLEADCGNVSRTRGLCHKHYERWRKANPFAPRLPGGSKPVWVNADGSRMTCRTPECQNPVETQGMCAYHYQHFYYRSTKGQDVSKRYRSLKRMPETPKCTVPNCDKTEGSAGYCWTHDRQKRRGEPFHTPNVMVPCEAPSCQGVHKFDTEGNRRFCGTHVAFAKRYTLAPEKVIALLSSASCSNPGCPETENLHLDHDHGCCPAGNFPGTSVKSCGECVRGLLCRGCNHALGNTKEDPRRIEGLLRYLAGSGG